MRSLISWNEPSRFLWRNVLLATFWHHTFSNKQWVQVALEAPAWSLVCSAEDWQVNCFILTCRGREVRMKATLTKLRLNVFLLNTVLAKIHVTESWCWWTAVWTWIGSEHFTVGTASWMVSTAGWVALSTVGLWFISTEEMSWCHFLP